MRPALEGSHYQGVGANPAYIQHALGITCPSYGGASELSARAPDVVGPVDGDEYVALVVGPVNGSEYVALVSGNRTREGLAHECTGVGLAHA